MSRLKELNLIECIRCLTQPFWLPRDANLFEYSSEGNVDLLGVFPGALCALTREKWCCPPWVGIMFE